MADALAKKERTKELANKFASDTDADIFVLNWEIMPPLDILFLNRMSKRKTRKPSLYIILTTEGGSADSAFRIMRGAQALYSKITVVVPGWCKSAGTLMCIGANDLQVGDLGELGPLDVQIVKADEMDEQKSGLVAEAAFRKLQHEAYNLFIGFVKDLGKSDYRVTLKTASEIATKLTTGMVSPIFDKLDPVTIGEDYRSNQLAEAYADRLNTFSKNLSRDPQFNALENLLSGYPSHGFVIDRKEAGELFNRVSPIEEGLTEIIELMGFECLFPRNRRSEQGPRLEFLNDEPKPFAQAKTKPARSRGGAPGGKRASATNGTADVSGNPEAGSEPGSDKQPTSRKSSRNGIQNSS